MAENSLNLVDLVKGHLTSDFGSKASSLLGETREKTQLGISAAIPGILAGLITASSTTDGAHRVALVVDNTDDSILSDVTSMIGRSTEKGSAVLRSLLGVGGLSELSGNIGRLSGLSGRAVAMTLGLVEPIVLSTLKRVKLSRGLDSLGLANLLSSQRSNIAAAMPERIPAGETYIREPLREVTEDTSRQGSRARATEETYSTAGPEHRKSMGWILPLIILAGLVGLVWRWSSGPSVRAARETGGVAQTVKPGQTASVEALKGKYRSVFQEAQRQGVRISSLTGENGKLVIRGTAPSASAANSVMEQIKRVNPRMNDVIADISVVEPGGTPTTPKAPENVLPRGKPMPSSESSMPSTTQTYIVKSGDTLSKISKQFYGNSKDYMRIFDENRGQLKNRNTIHVGQKLDIPAK